jgi:hypothetical protein
VCHDKDSDLFERRAVQRVDVEDVRDRVLVDVADDLVEEILLRPDVVVEAAFEDADLVRDVLDRGRFVPLFVEDAGRRLEDLLVPAARRVRCGSLARNGALLSRS